MPFARTRQFRHRWEERPTVRVVLTATLVFAFAFAISRSRFPGPKHSTRNDLIFRMASATSRSPLSAYPVPLTAGVIPKRMHSHNDYEQSVPLLKALSHGAASVEADIWLVDGQLMVAHTEAEIRPDRTLSSLYLEPLMALIEEANLGQPNELKLRGIFETAPDLSLQLLIDLKTDGVPTFDALYEVLQPLRTLGYLTTWSNASSASPDHLSPSLITIVGTGNTPISSVAALGHSPTIPRDIFLDAPLSALSLPTSPPNIYTPSLSPLASVNFGDAVGVSWLVPGVGRARIRALVEEAHARGIQARFWNAPNAPPWARNTVWQMLMDEGADWLNVDDLPAGQAF